VFIAVEQGSTIGIIKKVGSLDYTTGRLTLTNFNISDYQGNYITLKVRTLAKNIASVKNTILAIDPADVTVNVVGIKQ
jgi:hypothetical protein